MPRRLNACIAHDRKLIATMRVEKVRGRAQLNPDWIEEGLRLLCGFLQPTWLGLRAGAFALAVRPRFGVALVPELAASLGFRLQALSACSGFDRLLRNLKGKHKIWDAFFEAEAAEWCVGFPGVSDLEFEPLYDTAAGVPDFSIRTHAGAFVCECKNVEHGQLAAYQRLTDVVVAHGDVDRAIADLDVAVGEKFAEGLREAKGQLPSNEACGLFVKCLLADSAALDPLLRRLRRREYEHFAFVCIMSGAGARIIARYPEQLMRVFRGVELIALDSVSR